LPVEPDAPITATDPGLKNFSIIEDKGLDP